MNIESTVIKVMVEPAGDGATIEVEVAGQMSLLRVAAFMKEATDGLLRCGNQIAQARGVTDPEEIIDEMDRIFVNTMDDVEKELNKVQG